MHARLYVLEIETCLCKNTSVSIDTMRWSICYSYIICLRSVGRLVSFRYLYRTFSSYACFQYECIEFDIYLCVCLRVWLICLCSFWIWNIVASPCHASVLALIRIVLCFLLLHSLHTRPQRSIADALREFMTLLILLSSHISTHTHNPNHMPDKSIQIEYRCLSYSNSKKLDYGTNLSMLTFP